MVKLFKPEPESEALAAKLASRRWVSSELVSVEALCTARRLGPRAVLEAEKVLANVALTGYSPAIRERAEAPFARPLTALDAIHAATVLSVRDDVDGVYVYDLELSEALAAEGLPVASPGA